MGNQAFFVIIHCMKLDTKEQLIDLLTKELPSPLLEKAIDELWRVMSSPSNINNEVTKEHIINYYLSVCRYENYLKTNI